MIIPFSIWSPNYTFYEIRPEIKYNIINKEFKKKALRFYIALEIFYLKCNDEKLKHAMYTTNLIRATFEKTKYGVNIKPGIEIISYKRFTVGAYAGVGYKHKKIEQNAYDPITGEETNGEFYKYVNYALIIDGQDNDYDHLGVTKGLNLTIGIKVGVLLFSNIEPVLKE